MTVIVCKYHGPTAHKDARVSATWTGWSGERERVYLPRTYSRDVGDDMDAAAAALVQKAGLPAGEYQRADVGDGTTVYTLGAAVRL